MGAFYTNITLRGPGRERVLTALEERGRTAYVGPTVQAYTVVFDSKAEDQSAENKRLAAELAKELDCPALAVVVHDDDILQYVLFDASGVAVDRYDSAPGYFEGNRTAPSGGDAALLCRTIGKRDAQPEAVERILRAPESEYTHETGRLADLVEALGLPDHGVGNGYDYIRQGDADELQDEVVHVGEDPDDGGDDLFSSLAGLMGGMGDMGGMAGIGGMGGMAGMGAGGFPGGQDPMKLLEGLGMGGGGAGLAGGGPGGTFELDLEELQRRMASMADAMPNAMQMLALMDHPTTRYFTALAKGDAEGVRALFAGEPRIDDPRFGRVETAEALATFLEESAGWIKEGLAGMPPFLAALGNAEHALYQPVSLTETDERTVVEGVMNFFLDSPLQLPVATVWERAPGGEKYTALRVYHSMWPIMGEHWVRPPLVPVREGLEAPDVVGRYQAALAAGDVEAVVACFEPDGVAREPSGGEYLHMGAEGLRAFYASLFASGGGIPLGHCTVTDDGTRCAVEYVVTRWGASELPPQAGVAVYERSSPSGLLRAARIYDDVDPPGEGV